VKVESVNWAMKRNEFLYRSRKDSSKMNRARLVTFKKMRTQAFFPVKKWFFLETIIFN